MKKIMMTAAFAMLACVANAAAVAWNSGTYSNGFVGPDGNTLKGATGYTMTVYFYSDAAGENLITESSVDAAKPNGAFNTTTEYAEFATLTTYYTQAIITDGVNQLTTDIVSFTTLAQGNASINFTTGAGFDNEVKVWDSAGWQAVPEPTSGLLLLLGMAGLALRRKKA